MWLAITLLSLLPLPELPDFPASDKTHHLIAYSLLMFPIALQRPPAWGWYAIGFITWGGIIELVQPYVNRYGEWLDLLANAGGVLCAVLLTQLIHWLMPQVNLK